MRSSLNNHHQTHFESFVCGVCEKSFSSKCFNFHFQTLTGVKPVACDMCQKSFVYRLCEKFIFLCFSIFVKSFYSVLKNKTKDF